MTGTSVTNQTLETTESDAFYNDLLVQNKLSLQEKILNGLQGHTSDKYKFLPNNGIRLLPVHEVIKTELDGHGIEPSQKLLDFVTGRAKRLILILAHIEMIHTIPVFLRHDFDDDCIPIKLENVTDAKGYCRTTFKVGALDEITNEMKTEPSDCFKAFSKWRYMDLTLFEQAQWLFLAPIFTGNPFHHNIHEKRPLPFITYDTEFKTGFFGQVNSARIHSAHQKVSVGSEIPLKVAVKKLQRDASQRFRREADSLDIISRLEHRHIIKPLASFQQGDSFCFLFPWADGGNLTQFWGSEKEYSSMTIQGDELLLWSLEQLSGLAGGLKELYSKNGRHGDIKPENILRFLDKDSRGVLQLADMGLTKFHHEVTQSRENRTGTKTGTSRYEPPECEEHDESKPRSRDYDVWSMGCFYLEFLIWLLDGREALEKFTRRGNFEHFWEGRKHEYRIQAQVQEYMDDLSKRLECSNPGAENAFKDVLLLIRERLLKVKLADNHQLNEDRDKRFRSDTRANAVELHREISKIYQRAKNDQTYIKIIWTRSKQTSTTSTQLGVPSIPNRPKNPQLPLTRTFSGVDGVDGPGIIITPDEESPQGT